MLNNLKDIIPNITTFIFDVDGVLTDGTVTLMENGEQIRQMNIKDGYALQLAKKKGYNIAIITGGSSEAVKTRFNGLGITDVYLKAANKLEVFEEYMLTYNIEHEQVLYMGDDIPDYDVMKRVGLACCPADASEEIRSISQYVSEINGGEGCVRDVLEKTMKAHGKWFDVEKSDKTEEEFLW